MKFMSSILITLALSALAALAVPATSLANELEKRRELKYVGSAWTVLDAGGHQALLISVANFLLGTSTGPTVSGTKTTIGEVACFVLDSLLDLPCPNNLPAFQPNVVIAFPFLLL
ncbi:hypothetical protein C8J57DRAFT_1249123 [Mycena rebaudengoi]|nr:hypothetical protein C8J57DRAFT_1249123 [Mycena rebaudengoi]